MHDNDLTPNDDALRVHRVVRDRPILPLPEWGRFASAVQAFLQRFNGARMAVAVMDTHILVQRYDAAPHAHSEVRINRTWEIGRVSESGIHSAGEGRYVQEIHLDGRASSVFLEGVFLLLQLHFRDRLWIESNCGYVDWQAAMWGVMETSFPGPWIDKGVFKLDTGAPDPLPAAALAKADWRHVLLLGVQAKRDGDQFGLSIKGVDERGQFLDFPVVLKPAGVFSCHLHWIVALLRDPDGFAEYLNVRLSNPERSGELMTSFYDRLRRAITGWRLAQDERNFEIAETIANRLHELVQGRVVYAYVEVFGRSEALEFARIGSSASQTQVPVGFSSFDSVPDTKFGQKRVYEHIADWERRTQ